MTSTNDIRRSFLDFFKKESHLEVPSAPLVPYNDPTLMFVNAGMVPFKNVFTGLETAPAPRATSSQKCVRAGGKHNDLDNVGYTARHHTFFEMLGNFSFGDYFKEQAIENAWTLLTREWGIPAERLLATVYYTDEEALEFWRKIAGLPEDRIIRIDTNDNFWSMGDTGPCGPCSEIFYDHGDHIWGGPPGSAEEDGDRFVEIWNLVFMQFDQQADGTRRDLPKPSIDTGSGLERIAAVMQGVHNNYDIDTFKALIGASEHLTNVAAEGDSLASHRVIADHLRSTSFLMADGVLPSNEGRGYVLRRIMRRAMRHAHLLGASEPLMHRLVPSLVTEMGQAFPELVRGQALIEEVLLREETQFRKTLEKGLKLLDDATGDMGEGGELDGETAFKLYDTYGFPYDLTEDALRSRGLGVDRAGFDAAMARQKEAARAAWKGSGEAAADEVWFDIADREGASEFTGYGSTSGEGTVVALVQEGAEVASAKAGDSVAILTNQTPFYGTSGGQTGDTGTIASQAGLSANVTDTSKPLGRLHVHHAQINVGEVKVGDTVQLLVDVERRSAIRANHSATHLVHAALRNRLGEHVTQKGSLVAEDRLRFDFSHPSALTAEDIATIESEVNAEIRANETVSTRLMSPEDAVEAGALALFGEKYGDEVRVLSMGRAGPSGRNYSVELCGGTHVTNTAEIGLFKIVSESGISSGVRRIEAVAGPAVLDYLNLRDQVVRDLSDRFKAKPEEILPRVNALQEELKATQKQLAGLQSELAIAKSDSLLDQAETVGAVKILVANLGSSDADALKTAAERLLQKLGEGAVVLGSIPAAGKVSLVAAVSPAVNQAGLQAGKFIGAIAKITGGGGGGRCRRRVRALRCAPAAT